VAGKIFINYRRGDEPGFTQALLGRLEQSFPAERLFIDVDNIPPGEDFVHVLESQVAQCDTLLAVIGKGWLDATDERGNRRLDDPNDFVRIEIESALSQGKRVIPVLVHDARMPRPDELPDSLRPLATRNAVRLTHERFRADTQGLVKALQQTLEEIDALRHAGVEAARHEQAEEEHKRAERAANERANAHTAAIASDDPAALRSFLDSYPKGSDSDHVRARLGYLEPTPKWSTSRRLSVALGVFAVMSVAGAVLFWVTNTSTPPSTLQTAAVGPPPPPSVSPAIPVPIPAESPLSETKTPAIQGPDEVTWLLLKDTTDEDALRRFTTQYPNSPLRKDAEARIAALEAAQAAKPLPADQIAWALVKETKDPDQLRRFVQEFPNSPLRSDAEQRMASLSANALDPHELVRSLQVELKRVGCLDGVVSGEFDDSTKAALHRFIQLTSIKMPDEVSSDAINAVQRINKRVCPLVCPAGETAEGEQCVGNTAKPVTTDAAPRRPAPTRRAPAPARRASGKCFNFEGKQFCQ
jgi:TIR domain